MQKLWIFLGLWPFLLGSQTVKECKHRFDTYLNFRGNLNARLRFDVDAIYLLNSKGQEEFALYESELELIAGLLERLPFKQQETLLKWKGIRRLSQPQRDSLLNGLSARIPIPGSTKEFPLRGRKVAIDPGHFIANLQDAAIEQKFLYFAKDSVLFPGDSIKLFESNLTFNTAKQVQSLLEKQGAVVMLTRNQDNYTSFNCSYRDWLLKQKTRTLDSLKQLEVITPKRYEALVKLSDYKFFWDFFRDYDLTNRANKVNAFGPEVTLIIHYNVDEKNAPWKKTTEKDFTMAFIGGAFTANDFDKAEGKINFVRLLITSQLNLSEKLAGQTVSLFHQNLNIPIAKSSDAAYLKDNCLATSSAGVFSRNLVLCRRINSPLVYGESLYQDNKNESSLLMKLDLEVEGIKTNNRLNAVAKSYYQAVYDFLKP